MAAPSEHIPTRRLAAQRRLGAAPVAQRMTSRQDRVARRFTEVRPSGQLAGFETLPGGHSGITCLATVTLPGGTEQVVVKTTPPGRPPATSAVRPLRSKRSITARRNGR